MTSAYQARVLADGAVVYWPLDDPSGTTARDLAGTQHATISGGVTLGVPGAGTSVAMGFSALGQKIVSPSLSIPAAHTLEWWLNPGEAVSHRMISFRPGIAYLIDRLASGRLQIYDGAFHLSAGLLAAAVWHQVAITVAEDFTATVYVDGVADASYATTLGGLAGPLQLAADLPSDGQAFWVGGLQDVALYPRVLSPAEVSEHYTLRLAPDVPVGPGGPAQSSAIDRALLALLAGDTTLMALAPDGVYWDEAKPQAKRFVIVSLLSEVDGYMQGGRAWEDGLYLVKAVTLGAAATAIDAADRIDLLLEGAQLIATGYTPMVTMGEERIRHTEVDEADDSVRWFHIGRHYRIVMST